MLATFQKTTDAGATWTVYKDVGGLSSTGFYRTIYDGHFFDANTGLVCGTSGTLLRTTDGGATWDSVGVGSTSTMYDLFFLNSTVGYVTGTSTIDVWKTTDAGLTWTSTGGAVSSTCYGIYAIDEDTLLIAGTSNDVRRSTDGGASWTNVDIGGPTQETLRHVEMSSATNGWVVGDDGSAAYTTDAGATWTFANTGLGTTPDYNDVDFEPTPSTDDMGTVYPQSVNYWSGTTDGTTKTDTSEARGWDTEDGWVMFDVSSIPDGSTIDSILAYGYVNATNWPYWSLTPLPGLNPLTATASDLKTAIEANSGPGVAYVYRDEGSGFTTGWTGGLMGNTANADLQGALAQDWFAMGMDSRDNSPTYFINFDGWAEANPPYLEVYYTPPAGAPAVWVTGDVFDMYFTTDMGTSWNPFSHLDPSQAWTGEFFSTDFISGTEAITVGTRGMMNVWIPPVDAGIALNTWIKSGTLYDIWAQSEGGRVVAVGAPGISGTTYDQAMYSTDGGDTWAVATSDPTPHDFNDLSMVDSLLGYACLEDQYVYKTTDGGETWTDLGQVAVSTSDLEEIFFVDANTGYTFGVSNDGFKTTDGGATWSVLTMGVTPTFRGSYFIDADTGYVVGSSGTLLKTTDGGATFTALDPGTTLQQYIQFGLLIVVSVIFAALLPLLEKQRMAEHRGLL